MVRIQKRRDTAANWTSVNPILLEGEEGYEKDTGKTKMGDGVTAWNSLSYTASGATKSSIGLGNVDNTSDVNKPVSTAQQTALNAKVPTSRQVNGHALTADVTVTKGDVGLGNVDNTSDANKPVSTAQAAADALAVPLTQRGAANGVATLDGTTKIPSVQLPTLSKTDVGLGNVDNTSDVNKPVSTAQAAALTGHVNSTTAHPSENITFNDTGLVVVKGVSVKAALTAIDVWANARPRSGDGHLADLPSDADATWPNDSTFFVDDQFGGVTYRRVNGHWTQQAAGVAQASGGLAAGPAILSQVFDVKAVGITATDIPGMSLNIPASPTRGIMVRARFSATMNLATFPANTAQSIWLFLTDTANNVVFMDDWSAISSGATLSQTNRLSIEYYLPAPVTAITLKLRARTGVAVGAASSINIFPGYSIVANQPEPFYAQYV